jgi:hypothetical protein
LFLAVAVAFKEIPQRELRDMAGAAPGLTIFAVTFKEIPQRELRVFRTQASTVTQPVAVAFTEIPKRELRGIPGYPTPLTLVGNHALHSKKSQKGN